MLIKIYPLAVKRQAELLEIPIVYYLPAPTPEQHLAIERERARDARFRGPATCETSLEIAKKRGELGAKA